MIALRELKLQLYNIIKHMAKDDLLELLQLAKKLQKVNPSSEESNMDEIRKMAIRTDMDGENLKKYLKIFGLNKNKHL